MKPEHAPHLPTKRRIGENFGLAAADYDAAASLQRQVADHLLACLREQAMPAPQIFLDAGCGTGYVGRHLQAQHASSTWLALDLANAMLQTLDPSLCTRLQADQESLPLADHRLDLYISSLSLQWCDLAQALIEAQRVVKPGGWLAISTLTQGTFAELRHAFAVLDQHAHTLPLLSIEAVHTAAQQAGWRIVQRHSEQRAIHYPDLPSLLRAIKQVGANTLGTHRRRGLLSPRGLHAVAQAYEAFREPAGLPLTYHPCYLIARKD